jgi:hypothetical protein
MVMMDGYDGRNEVFASGRFDSDVAAKRCVAAAEAGRTRVLLEQQVAAELARERAVEFEADRRREQEGGDADRRAPVVDLPSAQAVVERAETNASLWPSGIRRPTRGLRWR